MGRRRRRKCAWMEFLGKVRKETRGTKIGMVGYCWGGKYAIHAGLESNKDTVDGVKVPLVDAAVALHPSNLDLPVDVENLAVPVSYAWGQEDTMSTVDQKAKIEVVQEKTKYGVATVPEMEHRIYNPGRHGFAVRGNPDDPEERACLEGAEYQVLEWLGKWL